MTSGRVSPRLPAQVARFAAVGVLSTAAYLVLYVLLRTTMEAQAANAAALFATAVGNTAANRRYTFDVRHSGGALRHQLQGLAVFLAALGLAAAALAGLHDVDPLPSRGTEVAALVAANVAATVLRFLALRSWVFRRPRDITVAADALFFPTTAAPASHSAPTTRSA
jgi:putative flippase GtrA